MFLKRINRRLDILEERKEDAQKLQETIRNELLDFALGNPYVESHWYTMQNNLHNFVSEVKALRADINLLMEHLGIEKHTEPEKTYLKERNKRNIR